MDLKDFNGREIKYFSNDEDKYDVTADYGGKMLFKHEIITGQYAKVDLFFIVKFDKNGNETHRYSYPNSAIHQIKWIDTNTIPEW